MELENEQNNQFQIVNKKTNIGVTFAIIGIIFVIILIAIFVGFAIFNKMNTKISSGIYIKGVNVSGLSKEAAFNKVSSLLKANMSENIKLKHLDYETDIEINQVNARFNIKSAVNRACEIGKSGNIFSNNFEVIKVMMSNINIEPILEIDDGILEKILEDISSKLPDTMIQSSYYIENGNLILTKGKQGNTVDTNKTKDIIKEKINDLNYFNEVIDIITETKTPEDIDIYKIHNEIFKNPIDAFYTQDPFVIHPHEDGVDFGMSVEEVKNMLTEEKEEYVVPLKIIAPNVKTNMIGNEAFPDLISSFSTKYSTSNKNRTTNLRLSSNKINGIVLMPGEVFSYNSTVGKRTIAAGYKEAAMYENGQVTDGLRRRNLPDFIYFI